MSPATHGPQVGGPGYLVAPFKGRQADILEHIAVQGELQRIEHSEVQALIWAVRMENLDYILERPSSAQLLKPEQLAAIRARCEAARTARQGLAVLQENAPSPVREAWEIQQRFRDSFNAFARGEMPFAELERYAVLPGLPPDAQTLRQIPTGRWQVHPDGYFLRYGTEHYATGTVDYLIPERTRAEFDGQRRPTLLLFPRHGVRIEFEYFGAGASLPMPNDPGYAAIPFKKVRVSVPGHETVEIAGKGFLFDGPLFRRSGSFAPRRDDGLISHDGDEERAKEEVARILRDYGEKKLKDIAPLFKQYKNLEEKYEKAKEFKELYDKMKNARYSEKDRIDAVRRLIRIFPEGGPHSAPFKVVKKLLEGTVDVAEDVLEALPEDGTEDAYEETHGTATPANLGQQCLGTVPHLKKCRSR